MASRDVFAEIEQLRGRNAQSWGALGPAFRRLDSLTAAIRPLLGKRSFTPAERELLRHGPVASIATLEGYFRGLIRDLIDSKTVFRANAANFKEIKLTIESVLSIHDGRATPGEFIAHFLGFSSLEELNRNVSTVLGEDFLQIVRTEHQGADRVLRWLADAFELRHILAHELSPSIRISPRKAFNCSLGVFGLLMATELSVLKRIKRLNRPANKPLKGTRRKRRAP